MVNFMFHVFHCELVTVSSEIYYKAKINPKHKNDFKMAICHLKKMMPLKETLMILLAS